MSIESVAGNVPRLRSKLRLSNRLDDEGRYRAPVFDLPMMRRLFNYIRPYWLKTLVGGISVVISSLTSAAGPWLIGVAIDRYIVSRDLGGLNLIVLVFIGMGIVGWGAGYLEFTTSNYVTQGALYDLRLDLFRHLERLSLSFYDANEVGRVMSRATSDVEQLEELLDSGILGVIGDTLTLGGVMAALLLMNLPLALATLTVVPPMAVAVAIWHKKSTAAAMRVRQTSAAVNSALQEGISGVRVIQSLCREDYNMERFAGVNGENLKARLLSGKLSAGVMPVVETLVALATTLIIAYGGMLVMRSRLEIGVLVAFALYVQRFFEPIRDLTMQYSLFQRSTVSLTRIFELLSVPVENDDVPGSVELNEVKGEIRFDKVSFSYLEGLEVLHDINVHVVPGETVALVGPTGAGKSTLASLVCRFYRASEGAVSIDGVDVKNISRASMARAVSLVPQDSFLFTGTIADNIRYGRLEATDEEVTAAAKSASAHDFIMRLKDGYKSQVQERGVNFSAGQRQLISLARAFLADPRILILDEATANIDTRTEVLIQEALGRLFNGRTSIVIAHRLSTVRNAHRILVIDGGRIVEEGNHEALLRKGGLYARLYQRLYVVETQGISATQEQMLDS